MRLGQLARKLEVKPSEIAELLNTKYSLEISVHPNSKIPDDHIEEVKNHFYFEPITESSSEAENKNEPIISKKNEVVAESLSKVIEDEPIVTISKSIPKLVSDHNELDNIETAESTKELTIEKEPNSEVSEWENAEFISEETKLQADTIKVPKVDLEGLKVIGKIDLPEPKVNSTEEDDSIIAEDVETAPVKVSKPMRKSSNSKRPEKRKYSEKEKAEFLEKKKLNAHLELLKKQKEEKKKSHYAKTQQQKKKTIPAKKKKKKQIVNTEVQKNSKYKAKEAAPTGFWGKFKKWLNDS